MHQNGGRFYQKRSNTSQPKMVRLGEAKRIVPRLGKPCSLNANVTHND